MVAAYIVLFIAIIFFYFLLSFIYRPLGRFIYKIFKDAQDAISEEDKEDEN